MASEETGSLVSYIPHLLFVLAQLYCGILLIILVGAPIFSIIKYTTNTLWECQGPITFENFVCSLPDLWKKFFNLPSGKLFLLIFFCYPIGSTFAEVFYRFAIFIKYHAHFDLESNKEQLYKDKEENEEKYEDEIKHYELLCGVQKNDYHRVWEWENFQSTSCYYGEAISLVFHMVFLGTILFVLVSHVIIKDSNVIYIISDFICSSFNVTNKYGIKIIVSVFLTLFSLCMYMFFFVLLFRSGKDQKANHKKFISILYIILVFCFLFTICFKLITDRDFLWMLLSFAMLIISLLTTLLMKNAREKKFKSFWKAQLAIKRLMDKKNNPC